MEIAPADRDSLIHILANLRQADREELQATRWDDDLTDLADTIARLPGLAWVGGLDGEPIAAIGTVPMWKGVWNVWMFATDRFPEIGLSLTRWAKRVMVPQLIEVDAHRVECRAMASHTVARKWLEGFGGRCESTLKAYGRNGEDFCQYVWSPKNVYA